MSKVQHVRTFEREISRKRVTMGFEEIWAFERNIKCIHTFEEI